MASANKRIVAAVVTHNRKDQLRECLHAVFGQEDASCDVIVIDNGSDDGTDAMVNSEFGRSGVHYFNAGANTGSAGGFHLAVYAGMLLGYDLIWAMDDDVVPSATALRALLDADRQLNGEWGFLSSVVLWKDGEICRPNIPKKGLYTFVKRDDYERDVVPVRIASMASLLLRADVVAEVGLPIAEYYIYTDDYEFTARISDSHPCYMVSGSRVTHCVARNRKVDPVSETPDRLWRYKYLYRNDVHFYRRYGLRGWAYLWGKALFTTAYVLRNEKQDKAGKLGMLWGGMREGIRFEPPVLSLKAGELVEAPPIASVPIWNNRRARQSPGSIANPAVNPPHPGGFAQAILDAE